MANTQKMSDDVVKQVCSMKDMECKEIAAQLEMSYSTVYNLLRRHGIKPITRKSWGIVTQRMRKRIKEIIRETPKEPARRPDAVYTNSRSPYGIADELYGYQYAR